MFFDSEGACIFILHDRADQSTNNALSLSSFPPQAPKIDDSKEDEVKRLINGTVNKDDRIDYAGRLRIQLNMSKSSGGLEYPFSADDGQGQLRVYTVL